MRFGLGPNIKEPRVQLDRTIPCANNHIHAFLCFTQILNLSLSPILIVPWIRIDFVSSLNLNLIGIQVWNKIGINLGLNSSLISSQSMFDANLKNPFLLCMRYLISPNNRGNSGGAWGLGVGVLLGVRDLRRTVSSWVSGLGFDLGFWVVKKK